MLKSSLKMVPARREHYQSKLVFLLFLASLGMFFIGSLITYLTIRDQAFNPIANAVPGSFLDRGPEIYKSLQIPASFWISTVALVFVSCFLAACLLVGAPRAAGRISSVACTGVGICFCLHGNPRVRLGVAIGPAQQRWRRIDEGLWNVIHAGVDPRDTRDRRHGVFRLCDLSSLSKSLRPRASFCGRQLC